VKAVAQAIRVLIVGAALGVSVAVVRGVPATPTDGPAATTCSAPVPEHPTIRWITQEDARALVNDATVTFVDARPREQFQGGHVAGSLSVPFDHGGGVPANIVEMLRGARTVVAYCDTSSGCAASSRLAGMLSVAGLADVRVLEGGMPAWLDHGYPAEAGSCRLCP